MNLPFSLFVIFLIASIMITLNPLQDVSALENRGSGIVEVGGTVGIVSNWYPNPGIDVGSTITLSATWDGVTADNNAGANIGEYFGYASVEGIIDRFELQISGCNLRIENAEYADDYDRFTIDCPSGVSTNGKPYNNLQIRWIDSTGQLLDDDKIPNISDLDASSWATTEVQLYGPNYSLVSGVLSFVSTTNSDVMVTTDSNGTTTTTHPDGIITKEYSDGTKTTETPDGTKTTETPDGTYTTVDSDGNVTIEANDGTYTEIDSDGNVIIRNTDGTVTFEDIDGTVAWRYPDGYVHTTYPDGKVTYDFPDGRFLTQYPGGMEVSTYPDGLVETKHPDGTITKEYHDGTTSDPTVQPANPYYYNYPTTNDSPTTEDILLDVTIGGGSNLLSLGEVEFSGTGTPGDQIQIEVRDSDYSLMYSETAFVNSDGYWYSSMTELNGGDYTVSAGPFLGPSEFVDFTIPESPPDDVTLDVTIGGGSNLLSLGEVEFSGTGTPGDTVAIEVYDDLNDLVFSEFVTVDSDGNWYSVSLDLDGGDYTVLGGIGGQLSQFSDFTIKESAIPEYQKNVFQWWSDGLVSDSEVMNGVEYLLTSGVIQSPNIQILDDVAPDVSGVKSETKIPEYQKNVFQWWSDGLVSDSEVMNGVEYLLTSGVIQSPNIKIDKPAVYSSTGSAIGGTAVGGYASNTQQSTQANQVTGYASPFSSSNSYNPTITINKEISELIYQTHMWNVASFTQLLQIKNFESKILKDASKDMWNEYGENKNLYTMRQATLLETESRISIEETSQALKSLNTAKNLSDMAKDFAIKNGNSVLELEDGVQEQEVIIDSVLLELTNYEDFKDLVLDTDNTQKNTIQSTKELTPIVVDTVFGDERMSEFMIDLFDAVNPDENYEAWKQYHSSRGLGLTFDGGFVFKEYADYLDYLDSSEWKAYLQDPENPEVLEALHNSPEYKKVHPNSVGSIDPKSLGGIAADDPLLIDESIMYELTPIISLGAPDIIKGHDMIGDESESIKNNSHPLSKVIP